MLTWITKGNDYIELPTLIPTYGFALQHKGEPVGQILLYCNDHGLARFEFFGISVSENERAKQRLEVIKALRKQFNRKGCNFSRGN